jgi:hydrogenase nickel incorporation protein HypA/HybF
MHEISLVRHLISMLEAQYTRDQLTSLQSIDLKIGMISNVEPQLLLNAFAAVTTAKARYRQVQLNIELVPVRIHCTPCNKDSTVKNYHFVCAFCGQPNNHLISGTELSIDRVHFL